MSVEKRMRALLVSYYVMMSGVCFCYVDVLVLVVYDKCACAVCL